KRAFRVFVAQPLRELEKPGLKLQTRRLPMNKCLEGNAMNRRRLLWLGASLTAATFVGASPRIASAAPRIDITQGNVQPISIAIPPFLAVTPEDAGVAAEVTQVITNNLRRSGLFAPIDPAAYIEKITNVDAVPQFE